jgi:hypothetical protein
LGDLINAVASATRAFVQSTIKPEDHDFYVRHDGHEKPLVLDFRRCGVPRVGEVLSIDDNDFMIVSEETKIMGRYASTIFEVERVRKF